MDHFLIAIAVLVSACFVNGNSEFIEDDEQLLRAAQRGYPLFMNPTPFLRLLPRQHISRDYGIPIPPRPTYHPSKPPTQHTEPPTKPTKPPTKPTKPPTKPTKPPTKPTKPPTKPTKPPTKPTKPPTKPTKPPTKPTKPCTKPPTTPPMKQVPLPPAKHPLGHCYDHQTRRHPKDCHKSFEYCIGGNWITVPCHDTDNWFIEHLNIRPEIPELPHLCCPVERSAMVDALVKSIKKDKHKKTTTEAPTEFECSPGSKQPDEHDCKRYYECDKKGIWLHYECPAGSAWNQDIRRCDVPENVPHCPVVPPTKKPCHCCHKPTTTTTPKPTPPPCDCCECKHKHCGEAPTKKPSKLTWLTKKPILVITKKPKPPKHTKPPKEKCPKPCTHENPACCLPPPSKIPIPPPKPACVGDC